MITIVHGDDTASSRKYFIEQKTANSLSFDGEKLTLTDLVQIIDGSSLFSDSKNIFIDDFFSKRKQSREQEELINYIKNHSKENNIYFWERKELSKKTVSAFTELIVKLFKLPQQLFAFLDSIRPNSQRNVVLFHEALKTTDADMIFFMLIRQFRLLLALSDESPLRHSRVGGNPENTDKIDEIKRLAPWQKLKFKKQSLLFSLDELKSAYKKLFEIDLGQKTGTLNMSLEQAIDMFLINI